MRGARVLVDFGESAAPARLDVLSFELVLTPPVSSSGARQRAAPANGEFRFVKAAGPYTRSLVERAATGARLAALTVVLIDSAGVGVLTVRLRDATVTAERLAQTAATAPVERQRLAARAVIAELTANSQDADRALNMAEALDRRRLSSTEELARAREHAAELRARLDIARRQAALLDAELRTQAVVEEHITVRSTTIDVDPGGVVPAPPAGGAAHASGRGGRPTRLVTR